MPGRPPLPPLPFAPLPRLKTFLTGGGGLKEPRRPEPRNATGGETKCGAKHVVRAVNSNTNILLACKSTERHRGVATGSGVSVTMWGIRIYKRNVLTRQCRSFWGIEGSERSTERSTVVLQVIRTIIYSYTADGSNSLSAQIITAENHSPPKNEKNEH